jgi:hypothetical protein
MKEIAYRLLDGKRIDDFVIEIVEVASGTVYGSAIDITGRQQSVVFNFTATEQQLTDPEFIPKILSALKTAIADRRTQLWLDVLTLS